MRRREFLGGLAGVASAWPLATRAQQAERVRRVGIMMNYFEDDPDAQARLASFLRGMQQLGWVDGHNVEIVIRWTAAVPSRIQASVTELIAFAPNVIFAPGSAAVALLKQATNRDSNRLRWGCRSGWRRLCRKYGSAGWQCDGIYSVRVRNERQMAGAAQRDFAPCDMGSRHSGYHDCRRCRAVTCNRRFCTINGNRIAPRRCSRCRRD